MRGPANVKFSKIYLHARCSVQIYIIRFVHRACCLLYTPISVHNEPYKLSTSTIRLYVLVMNRHTQGDVNISEYIILLHTFHMYSIKNT